MKHVKTLLRAKTLLYSNRRLQSSVIQEQNRLFDAEVERQRSKIGRVEKILISYEGKPHNALLELNKNISTPHDAAKHVSEWLSKDGALAVIDKEEMWDMHRPLERDCNLHIMMLTDSQPQKVNKVFWRSCSFLLGAVIQNAFTQDHPVTLHSFPSPRVTTGSFIHDAYIEGLSEWNPNPDELRALSADLIRLSHASLPINRLKVDAQLASDIFSSNQFKTNQIPAIAQSSDDGKITLYRVGQHIDISRGPMISNTSLIGRASIASVHKIETEGVKLLRFQGVALPRGVMLNHFAYKILEDRAKKLNLNNAEYLDRRAEIKC